MYTDIELLCFAYDPIIYQESSRSCLLHLFIFTRRLMLIRQLELSQKLQRMTQDAPNFVIVDFYHCKIGKFLSGFYHYVACFTHYNKCPDLCYDL